MTVAGMRMVAAAVFALALAGGVARAQAVTDPGDLAFWQSIQNSTNPAEYSAYLQAFPNGRFAALARLRAGQAPAGPATPPVPAPAPAPAPAPPPADDAASDYTIGISPVAGRVGQQFTPSCGNIPFGVSFDVLVIVPAGTPPAQPGVSSDVSRVLWQLYTRQCAGMQKAGPFAPGAYELRWMTSLFNNDAPVRYEMKAKVAFTVR